MNIENFPIKQNQILNTDYGICVVLDVFEFITDRIDIPEIGFRGVSKNKNLYFIPQETDIDDYICFNVWPEDPNGFFWSDKPRSKTVNLEIKVSFGMEFFLKKQNPSL